VSAAGLLAVLAQGRYAVDPHDWAADHEHHMLIGLINELHGDPVEGQPTLRISAFLGEVHARIAAHFALEEKFMRQRRYGGYAAHKADR
jgi:hemerythrin